MEHLYPGDGLEAAAMGLCSLVKSGDRERLILHKTLLIPHDNCSRKADLLSWDTALIFDLLDEANKQGYSVLKMHSHPGDYRNFSLQDDSADRALFPSIHNWVRKPTKHFSAVFIPDGSANFRSVNRTGDFVIGDSFQVIGDSLKFTDLKKRSSELNAADKKLIQAFGEKTHNLMKALRIGVVGCSGTGSCVIEALKRHMVGEIVLVDDDFIEDKNLNRIIGATAQDAVKNELKVNVMEREINKVGLGTKVIKHATTLKNPGAIKDISTCDVVFGCMDTVTGRHLLNLVCTYFCIPYFDVGVSLRADASGGLEQVVAATNYIQPGRSTLMSRCVYSSETLRAETILLEDPDGYQLLKEEGYIQGVKVDRPAVYTLNSFAASFTVEDFLARVHGYRKNDNICAQRIFSFTHDLYLSKPEFEFEVYSSWQDKVGLGDHFYVTEARRLKVENADSAAEEYVNN